MVTCCFLCQDPVYDNDIEERLDKAISKVVEENGTVRFLLYSYGDILSGRFHDLFATAAYRAKLANPHKEIRLSIVASDEERGQVLSALQKWQYPMPSFMFDEVLSPPTPQGIKDPFAIKKRMQRWMIGQADYVFTYLYDCLHEAVSHARDYAVKSGKALVDLTNPSTYALIREQYGTLPAQACKAMGLWLERKTTPEIAVELGVSRTRVQFLVSEGTRKIHDRLAGQEYQQAEAFCTVFLLGPATYASLSAFQKTVDYLICYKNVKTFCVPTDYLSSAFRYVLEKYKGIDKVRRPPQKPLQPTHVLLEGTGFLPGDVVFQLEKSCPLDKRRLRKRAGQLTAGQMERIDTALRSYFYLEDSDYLPLEIDAP